MFERLYADNHRLIRRIAHRYAYACSQNAAVDLEDLLQAGFLGLVAAARTFDENKAKWGTWAWWYVENAVRDALGLRSRNGRAALNTLSLDAPLSDEDDGSTLGDMQADPSLPDSDAALLLQEMQTAVRAAVDALPEGPRKAITLTSLQALPRPEAAQVLHVDANHLRRDIDKGMRQLRRNRHLRALALLDDGTPYWAHKGTHAFERDWTSTVEAAVLWREEWRERHPTLYADTQP